MRASVFILIFSLFCLNVSGFEIKGSLPDNVASAVKRYAENNQFDRIEDVLKGIGLFSYELNQSGLVVLATKKLRNISVKGNFNILESTLKSNIGFYEGMPLYLDTPMQLADRTEKFYRNMGFLDVTVKYLVSDDTIHLDVSEGKLYVMNSYSIVDNGKVVKNEKYKNPQVISEDKLDVLKKSILKQYRKDGYFNVTSDIIYSKSNRRFFFDINYPVMIVFSGVMFLHKNVDVLFEVNKGDKFSVKTDFADNETIIDILSEELKSTDSYHAGLSKYKISKIYNTQNVDVDIIDNIVKVSVVGPKGKQLNFHIEDSNQVDKTALIGRLKDIEYPEPSVVKGIVLNYLKELGFLSPFVNVYIVEDEKKYLCNIDIKTGQKYSIRDVFLNKKMILTDLNIPYSPEAEENVSIILRHMLESDYFFRYVKLENSEIYDNYTVNLYYKSDNMSVSLENVLSPDDKLSKKIKRLFSDKERLTNSALRDVRFYLKNSMNIHNSDFTVIEDNDSAVLVVDHALPNKNQLYLAVKYDNIDGFSGTIGYNRYNFFGSSFVLNSIFEYSANQNEFYFGLSKFERIKKIRLRYGPAYLRKFSDEDAFDVSSKKYQIETELFFSDVSLNIKLVSEYVKTLNSRIDEVVYPGKSNLLRLPVTLTYSKKFNNLNETLLQMKLMFNNTLADKKYNILETGAEINFRTKLFLNFYTDIKFSLMNIFGDLKAIPLPDRYALGGTSKMKAFSYRELGPADGDGDVYGGRRFVYGQIGLPYKISKYLFVGPFFEVAKIDDSRLYKDTGISLDVPTPVGDISIYYAKSFESWGKNSDALYVSFASHF